MSFSRTVESGSWGLKVAILGLPHKISTCQVKSGRDLALLSSGIGSNEGCMYGVAKMYTTSEA